ncbi:MAG: hypothetical protein ABR548_15380 [Actinomycetota bacterium]|nr:hypothetical protein [Actinomycetota bacterium]
MDWSGWATFGFVATAVLTAVMAASQMIGWSRMDLPFMLGAIVTDEPDRARVAGLAIHALNGQIFALLYAAAFALIGRASWWAGALFGFVHGAAALTLIVPALPGVHPRMASERAGPTLTATLEPPGPFALNYGRRTPLITMIAHVAYGAILGAFLQPR